MRLFGHLQHHPALTLKQLIKRIDKHDMVTVYRNVELFEKLGVLTRIRLGWETKIELSDRFEHHHHHLTCTNCGKTLVLKENPTIERELSRIGHGTGFKITDHSLEIRGLCKICQTTNV